MCDSELEDAGRKYAQRSVWFGLEVAAIVVTWAFVSEDPLYNAKQVIILAELRHVGAETAGNVQQ